MCWASFHQLVLQVCVPIDEKILLICTKYSIYMPPDKFYHLYLQYIWWISSVSNGIDCTNISNILVQIMQAKKSQITFCAIVVQKTKDIG